MFFLLRDKVYMIGASICIEITNSPIAILQMQF